MKLLPVHSPGPYQSGQVRQANVDEYTQNDIICMNYVDLFLGLECLDFFPLSYHYFLCFVGFNYILCGFYVDMILT